LPVESCEKGIGIDIQLSHLPAAFWARLDG